MNFLHFKVIKKIKGCVISKCYLWISFNESMTYLLSAYAESVREEWCWWPFPIICHMPRFWDINNDHQQGSLSFLMICINFANYFLSVFIKVAYPFIFSFLPLVMFSVRIVNVVNFVYHCWRFKLLNFWEEQNYVMCCS